MKVLPLPSLETTNKIARGIGASTSRLTNNFNIVKLDATRISLVRKGQVIQVPLAINSSGGVSSTVDGYSFYINRSILFQLWVAAEKEAKEKSPALANVITNTLLREDTVFFSRPGKWSQFFSKGTTMKGVTDYLNGRKCSMVDVMSLNVVTGEVRPVKSVTVTILDL